MFYIGDVYVDSADFPEIEHALCITDSIISEVEFNVEFDVTGSYQPATFYEPADYPELGGIVLKSAKITLESGQVQVVTDTGRLSILKRFLPEDDNIYLGIAEEYSESMKEDYAASCADFSEIEHCLYTTDRIISDVEFNVEFDITGSYKPVVQIFINH